MQIDWTKVKKSPVPATAPEGTELYLRGSGVKVALVRFPDGAGSPLQVRVYDETGEVTFEAFHGEPTTANVREVAREALESFQSIGQHDTAVRSGNASALLRQPRSRRRGFAHA